VRIGHIGQSYHSSIAWASGRDIDALIGVVATNRVIVISKGGVLSMSIIRSKMGCILKPDKP
jgi:hypothetical protein